LAIKTGYFIGIEIIGPAGAHLINQMGEALLQRFDRGIFRIGPTRPFKETNQ
jgi:hypothetical protein